MKEYTSKRAQEAQAKRSAAKEEEIQDCINDLELSSQRIVDLLSDFRILIKKRKKKDEFGKTLDSYKEDIAKRLSEVEDYIARLQHLSKGNNLIPHYQHKNNKWNLELTELEKQMEELTNSSLFNSLFGFGKKSVNHKEEKGELSSQKTQIVGQKAELFSNDAEQVKAKLTKLTIAVDSKIKSFCSGNGSIKSDIANFDSGLAILKSIVPNETMISHFESKQQEWKMKIEKAKKSKILVIIGVVILLILSDYL